MSASQTTRSSGRGPGTPKLSPQEVRKQARRFAREALERFEAAEDLAAAMGGVAARMHAQEAQEQLGMAIRFLQELVK